MGLFAMRPLLFAAVAVMTACTGEIRVPVTPTPVVVPDITVVSVAPREAATRPERTLQGDWSNPSALWLQQGAVTVLDGAAVKQRSDAAFINVAVGTDTEPRQVGTLRAVTRRADGVFLASTGGFFHDAPGRLLRAPVSDDFTMSTVSFVDAVGAALFVTTATGGYRVRDGHREAVRVSDPDETGTLQLVAGRTEDTALVVMGASLYAVDLSARTIKPLARGLATVTAVDHLADGSVLLGTSAGLVTVKSDDTVTRATLSADGSDVAIVDLQVTTDATLVATATQVLQLTAGGPVVLGDVTKPWPDALTKDAAGDVWFLDGATLVRLSTSTVVVEPPPVSFAADVKPFMTAKCATCHATGANYSPVINLENYGTAKTWATNVVNRLQDTLAPMPPASTEVLTPAQYDVVVRWVEGGLLP